MSQSLNFNVRVIGKDVRYADGAEQELIETLETSQDRSSRSDELAAQIHDWPTMYHLSPMRSHLLSPLLVGVGDRVLEVGCGTGVNVRVMAERGADVVGIEGTFARATAARIRNAEFDNVEILAGDISDYETTELFDVVLVIGVLEYTPSGMASIDAPSEFLRLCRRFLKEDGVLVLAIENQIGLKYLLSYPEDHLGIPWIGLEGYRKSTPRTWSRFALSEMLSEADFGHQEYLNPFPDYKLPNIVIRDRVYESEAGRELAKNFIRHPVVDFSGTREFVCDSQFAFAELVDARLGPDVANSFLVIASPSLAGISRRIDEAEMWVASGERLSKFRHLRRVISDGDNYRVVNPQGGGRESNEVRSGWLVNQGHEDSPVVRGTPLDDYLIRSILDDDWDGLATNLERYREFLRERATPVSEGPSKPSNPYGAKGEEQVIPGSLIDCIPQNLIVSPNEQLLMVDHEWQVDGDCALDLVFLRGLMVVANRLVNGGSATALVDRAVVSVVGITRELARTVGMYVDDDIVERLIKAEFEFQSRVAVRPLGTIDSYRIGLSNPVSSNAKAVPRLRLHRAAEERDRALSLLTELRADLALVDEDRQQVSADRDRVVGELGVVLADRDRVVGELGVVLADRLLANEDRERLADAISHLRLEVEVVRASTSYRIGRMVTWPVRAPRALLRRIAR